MPGSSANIAGKPILPVEDPVPSPCIGVCEMDPIHNWCLGCYRTMDEITDWFKFNDDKKRTILERVIDRKAEAGDNG